MKVFCKSFVRNAVSTENNSIKYKLTFLTLKLRLDRTKCTIIGVA